MAALGALWTGGCDAEAAEQIPPHADEGWIAAPIAAQGELIGRDGAAIGTVRVREGHASLLLQIEATGLAPGGHGVHLHEVGDCSDHAAFESAGEHIASPGREHGLLNPAGPHEGDLANLYAAADGQVSADLETDRLNLGEGGFSLLDADGTALVVHSDADDYVSMDGGGTGDRIACAVLAATAPE
jgi:Cu-Zn family superoxide dismutase